MSSEARRRRTRAFSAEILRKSPRATTEDLVAGLPFNRYYMDERLAPEAEAVYRAKASDPGQTWVTVRVHRGRGVLEELYIGGKPAREFIRAQKP